VKKCHGVETDHGRQRRETAEKPQVNEDQHATCFETYRGPVGLGASTSLLASPQGIDDQDGDGHRGEQQVGSERPAAVTVP
jgi:hypothetical protein